MLLDIKGTLLETCRGLSPSCASSTLFQNGWNQSCCVRSMPRRWPRRWMMNVVLRHRVLETIHFDLGRSLRAGSSIGQVHSLIGANKTRTSPFHPSGNSGGKRFNRTMEMQCRRSARTPKLSMAAFYPMLHGTTTALCTAAQACHHSERCMESSLGS